MDRFIDYGLERFPFGWNSNHAAASRGFDERHIGPSLERKVMRLYYVASADDDRTLNDILELPNIAWPAVSLKRADGILSKTQMLPPLAFGVPLHKVVRQNRNVSLALAERWKLESRHVKAVEQVGAEAVFADGRLKRRVCAGDYAGVKRFFLGPPEAPEAAVLNHTQQLRLELQGKLSNLVEKNGPGTRHLEKPALQRSRISERARLVTEQLALEQCLGNSCAIYRDERFGLAWARRMEATRKKLFPRPRLTDNQNGQAPTRGYLSR